MAGSDTYDEQRLARSSAPGVAVLLLRESWEPELEWNEAVDELDDGTVQMRRSFPRPLIPLLEFL